MTPTETGSSVEQELLSNDGRFTVWASFMSAFITDILVYTVGVACLLVLFRRSLRHPHSHGFPRFFGFLFLLGLVVLNTPWWFSDPFSPAQLISWALLLVSLALAFQGFSLLHRKGKPIAPAVMELLLHYPWPGNIRELENTLEHAVVCSKGSVIELGALPRSVLRPSAAVPVRRPHPRVRRLSN